MEYDVYADVMFLTNFTVDLIILAVSRLILKHFTRFYKMLLAAFFGALYATVIYFIDLIPFVAAVILNVAALTAMTLIAYGFTSFTYTVKRIAVIFSASFLFGGIVYSVYFFSPLGTVFYLFDGSYYFDISFLTVLILALFSLAFCFAVSKTTANSRVFPCVIDVSLTVLGKTVSCKAFYDTGNSLTATLYDFPVIVCEHGLIKQLLPEELRDPNVFNVTEKTPELPPEITKRLYTVFAKTVGGETVMLGLPVDMIEIKGYGLITKQTVVAISPNELGKYKLILNPQIF